MFKGNSLGRQEPILDGDHANLSFVTLVNALVSRVFTDVYLGSGAPDAALGEENDIYINLAALTYYTKTGAGWGSSTALDNNANAVLLISSKR